MHLVRAARQGGVVVLMSYVRRLRALGACHEPVKVASLCPDVICTMFFVLYVYESSLFKAVVSIRSGESRTRILLILRDHAGYNIHRTYTSLTSADSFAFG